MKIVLTGSLGHISKPLAEELVQKGHDVTVISSNPEKQKNIEAMGAIAAIGTMEDADFLTKTFQGADAVYAMEAMGAHSFMDPNLDIMAAINKIGNNYKQAIQQSGVKRVVHLSSIGAHTDKGNGILAFHYNVEKILNQLPGDVSITFMRPVGFYYNLIGFIPVIKNMGMITSNYGGDARKPWVSPIDIAATISEEIVKPLKGRKVLYVASEEISCDDIAGILGDAIGNPDLKWVLISNEQMQSGMEKAGMPKQIAAGFTEMNAAIQSGALYDDYNRNRPTLGKVKLKDWVKEFAAAYNKA